MKKPVTNQQIIAYAQHKYGDKMAATLTNMFQNEIADRHITRVRLNLIKEMNTGR